MKNVKVLYEPDEIRAFFRQKWKTDTFREEQEKPGSFINQIVERAALYPMFTYEFSDHPSKDTPQKEKTEWAHFGSWWGGITDREYANPAISDAYWLHEAYHKGYMTYEPGITFEGFKDKTFRNELNASMASEIELYMHHPALRQDTFAQEIFADRFLNDPHMMQKWAKDPWGTRDALRVKRKELMLRENKDDPVEYWIHKFAQQNEAWAAIWSRRYDQVETQMAEMHGAIDTGGSRKDAMDKLMGWLQSPEVTRGTAIPFPDEAEAFAGVYRLNNRHYQESVERGDMSRNSTERMTSPAQAFLKQAYPDTTPAEALAGPVAREVLGALPAYSGRKNHQISNVTTLMAGSFAVIHATDTAPRGVASKKNDPLIIMQRRSDKGPAGEERYGMLGGFTSLDDNKSKSLQKEQPSEGCAREIREECIDNNGKPVLSPDPSRLRLLTNGIDYRREPGTFYSSFDLALNPQELADVRAHSERMQSDAIYADQAHEASHGEVAQIIVKPLSEVIAMNRDQFTHPHEFDAVRLFEQRLREQPTRETAR